jgi:hypothetical protein
MPVVDPTTTTLGSRVAARLTDERALWLVTVDPHGTPQPKPVLSWWDGADGVVVESEPRTAKLRNAG